MSASVDPTDLSEHHLEEFLNDVAPTRRGDYRAVVLEGKRPTDRAQERGVSVAAISTNVRLAREELQGLASDRLQDAAENDADWRRDVVECIRCRGTGERVECSEDLCYARGYCTHGNNTCALCRGVGRATKRLTDRWRACGSFESVEATDYDLYLQGTIQAVARERHDRPTGAER